VRTESFHGGMSFTNGSHGINKPFVQRISLPSLKNKTKKPNHIPRIANGDEMHNPYVRIFIFKHEGG
jgi:hypothetical protein